MSSQSFSDVLEALAVLEQICRKTEVLEEYKNFPEWSNALNDCLSLCKRVARQSETAQFLEQEEWGRFIDVICSESKDPGMFPEALAVLKKSLESENVVTSVCGDAEFNDCFGALKQLAESIEDDHMSGMHLGNTLWKELRRIVKLNFFGNAFVVPEARPAEPEENEAIPNYKYYKEMLLNMPLKEKRRQYACKSKYKTLSDIPTWQSSAPKIGRSASGTPLYPVQRELNEKISMFVGDITTLEIDAIVASANCALMGGGGVDGAIHHAAGPALSKECRDLKECETGKAKITGGYLLPAKYVIHAVGPVGCGADKLQSCYKYSLDILLEKGLKTIAFPCISTGLYCYPNEEAAMVALKTVRDFLQVEENAQRIERIIFCLFLPTDVTIYKNKLPVYFPVH